MLVSDREGDIGGNVWMALTIFVLHVLGFVSKCCSRLIVSLETARSVLLDKVENGAMQQEGVVNVVFLGVVEVL